MTDQLRAFVIMPFNEGANEVYDAVIKPTAATAGFNCLRADEIVQPVNIHGDIIRSIDQSDIVIADLTGRNPNVFYELALSHSIGKPTVMIARSSDDVPFDLSAYRIFLYDTTMMGGKLLASNLRAQFDLCAQGMLMVGSPVRDHMEGSLFGSVVRTREVTQCEANAKSKVCVLAPDIELGPSVFRNIMIANLSRGVSYQYLVANKETVVHQLEDFVESMDLGDNRARFKARLIDPDFIESDVTIIDPNSISEQGFILAPAEKAGYHYRVVGGALYRAKERFTRLWFRADEKY